MIHRDSTIGVKENGKKQIKLEHAISQTNEWLLAETGINLLIFQY